MSITSGDKQNIFEDVIDVYRYFGLYITSAQSRARWYDEPGLSINVPISASPLGTSGRYSPLDIIVKGVIEGITTFYSTSAIGISAFGISFTDPLSAIGNIVSLKYNVSNLKITNGQLNTIQDISTTAIPSWPTINVTGLTNGQVVIVSGGRLVTSALNSQIIDHGSLTGLSDDDHIQYIITNPSNSQRNVIQSSIGNLFTLRNGDSNSFDLLSVENFNQTQLLRIKSDGTFITSANIITSGKIGIKTSDPDYDLDLNGNMRIQSYHYVGESNYVQGYSLIFGGETSASEIFATIDAQGERDLGDGLLPHRLIIEIPPLNEEGNEGNLDIFAETVNIYGKLTVSEQTSLDNSLNVSGAVSIWGFSGIVSASGGRLSSISVLPISVGGTNNSSYTASQFLWYNGSQIVSSQFSNLSFLTSANGTTNLLSKFVSPNQIGNSIISDDGLIININGGLTIAALSGIGERYVTVASDGSLRTVSAAIGSVSGSGSGTVDRIAKFITSATLGDSIMREVGSVITVSGGLNASGNINVHGATNATDYKVNVHNGHIAVDSGYAFRAFAQDIPAAGSNEFVAFRHNGSLDARIEVDKNGSGEYRGFRIYTGGNEQYRVTSGGVHSFGGNININGATNATGYRVNSLGNIAAHGPAGLYSFGIGQPSDVDAGNSEYIRLTHTGTEGNLVVSKTGTGSYRDLVIYTGDAMRYRITSAGVHTIRGQTSIENGPLNMENIHAITWKNASGTIRNVLSVGASNNLEIGGTIDNGILFFTNLGTFAGKVTNNGVPAWHFPGAVSADGNIFFHGERLNIGGTSNNAVINANFSMYFNIDADNTGTEEFAWGHNENGTGSTRLMSLTPTLLSVVPNITIGSNGSIGNSLILNTTSGTSKYIEFRSDGVIRWAFGTPPISELGSNTGTPLVIESYTDGGSFIDYPIYIIRAANGTMTFSRPSVFTSTISATGLITASALNVSGIGSFKTDVTVLGNVGIKITSASYALDVNGDIQIRSYLYEDEIEELSWQQGYSLIFQGTNETQYDAFYAKITARGPVDLGDGIYPHSLAIEVPPIDYEGDAGNLDIYADIVSISNELEVSGPSIFYDSMTINSGIYVNSLEVYGNVTFDPYTVTFEGLAGTGTRLVASTSAGIIQNPTIIDGNYTFTGTLTFSGASFYTGSTNISGNINVNGATNATDYRVNVHNGHIAVDSGYGFRAFAQDVPAAANNEFVAFNHSGPDDARIEVDKNGSGEYRGFRIYTAGNERYRVTSAGIHSFGDNININGATNATGYRVNSLGNIAAHGPAAFYSFGIGQPSDTASGNSEYIRLAHTGTEGNIVVSKTGSGSFRDMIFYTGDAERLRLTSGGDLIHAGALNISGITTLRTTNIVAGALTLDNAQNIVLKNASGTSRNAFSLGSDNNLNIGGTIDNGILFFTNLGTFAGKVTNNGVPAWHFPGAVSADGDLVSKGDIIKSSNVNLLAIAGGNTSASGANILLYGSSHATQANDFIVRTGSTPIIAYDHSAPFLEVDISWVRFDNITSFEVDGPVDIYGMFYPQGGIALQGGGSTTPLDYYEEGSYTATGTGFAGTPPTSTARFVRCGNLVTIHFEGGYGESNSTSMTITGMPAQIWPAREQTCVTMFLNNGIDNVLGVMSIGVDGVIYCYLSGVQSAPGYSLVGYTFTTGSATKGWLGATISYIIS